VGATHPCQVHVHETIRGGKQPRGLGWGMFSQEYGQGNRRCNQQNGQDDGKASSYSHVSAAAPAKRPFAAGLPRMRYIIAFAGWLGRSNRKARERGESGVLSISGGAASGQHWRNHKVPPVRFAAVGMTDLG